MIHNIVIDSTRKGCLRVAFFDFLKGTLKGKPMQIYKKLTKNFVTPFIFSTFARYLGIMPHDEKIYHYHSTAH